MKIVFRLTLLVCACVICASFAFSQTDARQIEKVEPPSWFANHSINPVRVLLRGKNLDSGKMAIYSSSKLIQAKKVKASANGNYLFVDLAIAPNTKPGKYEITLNYASPESVKFEFEILPKLAATNRFRGFTTDDVIYFLLPDRFADGDSTNNDPEKSRGLFDRTKGRYYHGGDLEGLIGKLDYIKSLGATAIWTTPVYDNNDQLDTKEVYPDVPATTGYHGYGAIDMYAVDEHLGDMAKLKEFVQIAQSKGLKVIQDQVANHTGPYHVWANDPPTATWWNGTVDNHLSNNWQKWTTMNPRATAQTQKRNLNGWFIDILPDFNQNDPEVERYLIQNTLWWMGTVGFDAIRMDTLPHVPRRFWAKWMTAIKREYPNVNVLGELYDSDPALLAYFQAGRRGHDGIDTRIDTLYDFGLFSPLRNAFGQGKPVREVSQMFAKDWLYPNAEVLTTFIGVHDMPRFMNEPGATVEGLKLAQTLIMTARGTPLLYYGDEIAMRGGADPDNRRDFPGGFPADGINAFAASGRSAEQSDVWNHLAKLGQLRKELEPLRRGKSLDLHDGEQQLAFARVTDKQAVIMVFNNDTKPAEIEFSVEDVKQIQPNANLVDWLGKIGDAQIINGNLKISLPARSASILTIKQ